MKSVPGIYRPGLALELVSQGVLAVTLWGVATSDPLLAVSGDFLLFFNQDFAAPSGQHQKSRPHFSAAGAGHIYSGRLSISAVSVGLLGLAG